MLFDEKKKLEEVYDLIHEELGGAVKDPTHPFRFLHLCTLSNEGPDSRYVVLRDVDLATGIYVFSDSRAAKVAQLIHDHRVSLLFYNPQKHVQLRVKGHATIHQNSDIANSYWTGIPNELRKAYNQKPTPGTAIANPSVAHDWQEAMDQRYFAVIQIRPLEMDVLQLHGLTHLRARFFQKNGRWAMDWIAP